MALVLAIAPRANAAYIYWADPGDNAISRANVDGTHVIRQFVKHAQYPCGVAVDARHIYWANLWNSRQDGPGTTIGRANLDGSRVTNAFIRGALWPCGVAVGASHLYWADGGSQNPGTQPAMDGTIGSARLDGRGIVRSLVVANATNGGSAVAEIQGGLALDGAHLYWGDWANDTIGIANLDGTGANDSFISLPSGTGPEAVAVTGGRIYWGGAEGRIGRANVNGTGIAPEYLRFPEGGLCGMASSSTSVYWAWVNDLGFRGGIGRAALNDHGTIEFLTGKNGGVGCGIAVGPGSGKRRHATRLGSLG
jgi:hypothetical protein